MEELSDPPTPQTSEGGTASRPNSRSQDRFSEGKSGSRPNSRQQDRSSPNSDDADGDTTLPTRTEDIKLLVQLATSYLTLFEDTGELEDYEKAIMCMDEAGLHSDLPPQLDTLGQMFRNRYDRLGELSDLDKAIEYKNQAVALTEEEHSEMPSRLSGLGSSYESRFQRLGELEDLEKAIVYKNYAVTLTPEGDSDMPTWLNALGLSLESRFLRQGDLSDLEEAIDCQRRALSLTPDGHKDMPTRLSNLGCSLESRYERLGDVGDLEKAIRYKSKAVALTPEDHPDMPGWLNNFGLSLESRFECLGELVDLNNAIELQSRAVSLTPDGHPELPTWLNNLGSSLGKRFARLGNLSDLSKAIEYKTQAVSLTPQGHADMATLLTNLGNSLRARFTRLGELEDLEQAIKYQSEAVSLTPNGHLLAPIRLSNLGSSLYSRYENLGKLVDLDGAIKYMSLSLSLMPQGHSSMPKLLSNLGTSLAHRYEHLGELADSEKSFKYHGQALELTPKGHPDMPSRLSSLGSSYIRQFNQLGQLEYLEKAIDYMNQAVALTPQGHSEMPLRLGNLAYSLENRFENFGEAADLDKAIGYRSQALSLTSEGHADTANLLYHLGSSLQSRYDNLGELADLSKAIDCMGKAVALTPHGHASVPSMLYSLGCAYRSRSKLPGMPQEIDKSLDCFKKAANSAVGSPLQKLISAQQWVDMCLDHGATAALPAYQRTMSLLPQIIWLGSSVDSRYKSITDLGSVAAHAVAVAIEAQDYQLALEWLEQGRSIVWKQMLQLRTPFEDLSMVNITLATDLKRVARDLDQAGSPHSTHDMTSPSYTSLEDTAQRHRRLAEKWEELLDEARRLPGFEGFLLPEKASELMRSAQSGPVVVIKLDKISCDALIIQPGLAEVAHVPLKFSYEQAAKTRIQLDHMVRSRDLTSRCFMKERRRPRDVFGGILTDLWTDVVKPVLEFLGYMQIPLSGDLPHITWCTTGPLSFLPLHAAGDYNRESDFRIFNYVVSSYTPTLSALIAPPSAPTTFSGILAVGQSSALGMTPLPGTVAELTRIQERSQGLTVTRLDGDLATPVAVLAGMEEHSWVHLACHAMQNTTNPIESAFYLHGGTLDLAAITQKQLKRAKLAFLSACQTATGDKNLSEEAVHLAAGMLMAGYRTVIATMWSIGDEDAPLIAEKVYEHLLEGGTPDARRAAVAVHKATACLREKVGMKAFAKWVPYIHIGI